LANGDKENIIGTRTEGTSMEQNNRSFGELDLNVEPIEALDEHGIYARYLSTVFFFLIYYNK
jgi:hypothetical protein